MAENKKSIIVYADWINKFEELDDDEAGRLIKHFFRYVNDLNPEYPDRTTKLMFIDIKATLKRDLIKWEDKAPQRIEKARVAGLASAEARKLKKQLNSTNELQVELKPTKPTVSVSVNVSDSVSENVKENINTALPQKFSFYNSLIYYGFKKELVSDWISVRKNKKATNTQTAFNSFIREIEKRTCNLNEILEFIVSKNWSGFKWEWYDKENNFKSNENGKSTITQTEQFKQIAQAVRSDGIRR